MLSLLIRATLALSVASTCFAQTTNTTDRFVSEIPPEEAQTLAEIVEDPAPVVVKRGNGGSPAYNLYSAALPIPPLAQVKQ